MTTRPLTDNEQTIIIKQLQAWMPAHGSIFSDTPVIYDIASPSKRAIVGTVIFILIFLYTLKNDIFKNFLLFEIIFIILWYPFQYFCQNFVNNRIINALPHLPENATYTQYYKYMYGF
jgi:hypothetical protein